MHSTNREASQALDIGRRERIFKGGHDDAYVTRIEGEMLVACLEDVIYIYICPYSRVNGIVYWGC